MRQEVHLYGEGIERLAYRPDEAARALGVGRNKIYDWLNNGTLRSVKDGNARLIPRDVLLAFLADRTKPQPAKQQ